jgi:hypothetical protein
MMRTPFTFVLSQSRGEEILPRPGRGERVGVRGFRGSVTEDEGPGDEGRSAR